MRFFIFLFSFCVISAGTLFSQSHFEAGARQLTQEAAAVELEKFRHARMPGDFCLMFQIVHQNRDNDDDVYCTGTLWGTWIDDVPHLRLTVRRQIRLGATLVSPTKTVRRMLIVGGENPELWEAGADGVPVKIDSQNTESFFEGLVLAPFDLQTPFVYWRDFKYLNTRRLRGRVSHFYELFPPEGFKVAHPEIEAVRIAMDRTYNALVSVETLGGNGKAIKKFSLGSVKKVREDYIFKTLEVRDERSRDKDVFEVKYAALRLDLSISYFEPKALGEKDLELPSSVFERF
ncbi:MAG: hypothetical protein K6B46_04995 [Opitutales bacterium]|nr:hypothetical protein [Opitutales bacterium]